MEKREYLPLTTGHMRYFDYSETFISDNLINNLNFYKSSMPINKPKLYVIRDRIKSNAEELESFLLDNKYMNSINFSRSILLSQEIKTNNTIEGYNDDLSLVYDIVKHHKKISDKDKMQRIMNLYKGYRYIFKKKVISQDSLKELYKILSKDLLSDEDLNNMGEYYRKGPVYIFYSDVAYATPDEGLPYKEVEEYMNELFEFINDNNIDNTATYHFIKSQIMHYQFVNIHPYFDINGRASRTLAMWYLLNNEAFPYIIFNRGISLNKRVYYKVIREVKKYDNLTYFINFMLNNVRIELEKEYIIDMIKSVSGDLSPIDYQSIYYILSMNGLYTAKDFATFYNRYNDKKGSLEIYKTMLEPLLDKDIIIRVRDTKGNINSTEKNFVFEINKCMYENDSSKIKILKI